MLYGSLLLPWARLSCDKRALKAALNPAKTLTVEAAVEAKLFGYRAVPASRWLTLQALRLKSRDGDDVARVHEGAAMFHALLGHCRAAVVGNRAGPPQATGRLAGVASSRCAEAAGGGSGGAEGGIKGGGRVLLNRRSEAGLALRHCGPLWRAAVLVAIVDEATGAAAAGLETVPGGGGNNYTAAALGGGDGTLGVAGGKAVARASSGLEDETGEALLRVANRGASPMGDVLSAAVTLEMEASAKCVPVTIENFP